MNNDGKGGKKPVFHELYTSLGFRVFNAGRRGYYKANSRWNHTLREQLEEKSKGPKHGHSTRGETNPNVDQERKEESQRGLSSSSFF